ncbi:acylase [Pseudomonas sp. ABC1]|uniref:bifunctional acylase PvdQ n=1 Tax=Pseudomonas sp. ABC1 TaxID=2748080 RepID=UPI0015C32B30|nr:acylase [Pseudomonas sp. ABC1]QLF91849.1 acylase [Pseudomonas sp. ABC1]
MNTRKISTTLLVAACLLAGCSHKEAVERSNTLIRWTSFGVPHITASDEKGLGLGVGYAYARDNLCLMADEVVTARGERSKYFGQQGVSSARHANMESDFFFRWLNDERSVAAYWEAQPEEIRQLLSGYAEGFNRYLAKAGSESSCHAEPWLSPLDEKDLVRLIRRLMVEGGAGQFLSAIVAAEPPRKTATDKVAHRAPKLDRFALERGSNAIAVGGERSGNGKGRLLANPHFPWQGALRFYQMHLQIPGKLDVMGASLPGLPVVNIGFNRHVAWTHTVDTSSHFTLFRLELDPQREGHYLLDGQSQPFERRTVQIDVKGENGDLERHERIIYSSHFGPLLNWPGVAEWDEKHAYALKDANLDNPRAPAQWYAINQTDGVASLRRSIEEMQGIPWVNTLAADEQGNALFMNASVVPNVPEQLLHSCADTRLLQTGLPGLDGSRRECDWQRAAGAAQAGILPASSQPVLERRDFVQNSNDSAWMTNPAAPLTGFSPLVSRTGLPLKPRTRFALEALQRLKGGTIDEAFLQHLVIDNRVYMADVLLDDVLASCRGKADLAKACGELARWNRRADGSAGSGWAYFQAFMERFARLENPWEQPFDAEDPINTPRGIDLAREEITSQLEAILFELSHQPVAAKRQIASTVDGEPIAIPGGPGELGIYNAIQTDETGEVVGGTSYIQLVSFTEQGPVARGLLAFSQATEAGSAHRHDQTRPFVSGLWKPLPFTEQQISSELKLESIELPQ